VTQVSTTFGGGGVPRQAGPHGEASGPAGPPPPASRLGGRKGLLAVVAGVVLLAVAGGGGYLLLGGSSDPQPTATPSVTGTRSPAAATGSPTHSPSPTVAKATPHATFDPFYGNGSVSSSSGAGSTGAGSAPAPVPVPRPAPRPAPPATASPTAAAAVYVSLVGWMSGPMADLWINAKHQPLSVGSSAEGVKLVSQLPPDTTGQVCAKIVSTTNSKLTATVCPGTSVALG